MAKKQIFKRKKERDYLAELEELLKKNKGTGLYEAFDVNPRAFRIGGRVVDPSGLGQDVMRDDIKFAPYDYSTIPMTAPNVGSVGQFDFTEFPHVGSVGQFDFTEFPQEKYIQRADPASFYNDPRYQEALSQPVETTQEDKDQIFQETGKAYAIQQLKDGGILYIDGLIRYDDGTIREYTGKEAEAIASMEDGSTRYSDGSVRRKATPQEFDIQSNEPAYPIASQADGTVMYSDGIARAFDPQAGQFKKAHSGVINFFNTFNQGYRFQPRGANDLTGQCAWFSQQITTLPDGSEWRIGNTLEQKQGYLQNYMAGGMAFMPGQEDAKAGQSIVFDEGTRYGHVATISEIFRGADGQVYYRLTESNYSAPNTVTHDRVVRADDPKILGIIKTVPRRGYTKVSWEEAPQVTGERALQVPENASQTGEQERAGEDAPEDKQVQEAPLMSQEVQPQQEQGYQPSELYKAVKPAFDAIEPMSPQRQALGQGIAQVGQAANLPGLGVSELVEGDRQKAGQEIAQTGQKYNLPEFQVSELVSGQATLGEALSRNIEQANLTPRIDTGLSELLRGDVEGAKANFADTLARAKARIQRIPEEIGRTIVPEVSAAEEGDREKKETLAQNLAGAGKSIVQYAGDKLAQAGEGLDTLKDKVSNAFQKTPLMGLFQGQKQVGYETPGITMIETTGQRGGTPTPDAFFRYGGADQYGQYLIDNAEQARGGALSTSLFKPEFYQDPNRVANVFGETSQGKEATNKYKEYLKSQIKPGYDQPYRTEQKQEGDTLYEYKIPIPEYFQNQYYQNLLAETPDTLKSGFSFDQFQLPTTTKSVSEYKGQVPVKDSLTPIFKSGVVDLFRRSNSNLGQLAGNVLKSPAGVYQPSQQSARFEVPETTRSIFQIPSPSSVVIPPTSIQKTIIKQPEPVKQPTLSDYLARGKTEAQYYAETGQQSTLDAINKAKAYTSPEALRIGQTTGAGVQKIGNTVAQPGYTLRVDSGGNIQQVKDTSVKLPTGATANFDIPVKTPSAQLSSSASNNQSIFSPLNWLKKLFKR